MAIAVPHTAGDAFSGTPELLLGVEEELLLVDEHGALSAASDLVLERLPQHCAGHVLHEIYDETLEIVSPVCRDAFEAGGVLARLRSELRNAGARILGAGLHPEATFGVPRISSSERYRRVAENLAGLLRNPTCALHVHVSMPDPETAVRVYNAIRVDAPLLLALSANSPFWHGIDSGLASARTAIVRSYPRGGMARAFRDYEDFLSTARSLADVAEVEDYTYFWWDVRLQPRFGTVEVRIMDAQTSLDLTTGLIALVHGLAADALWHPREVRLHDEVLQESSYRAARYGMDGRLPDAEGRLRPVPELARDAIARVRPFLRERGGHEALAHIEDALIHGNGAVRQRAAYARGGMRAVTEQLAQESCTTSEPRRAPDEPGPFVRHRRVSR